MLSPVQPTVSVPVFEGPLDLLLHLLREHKLDVADIPIVLITDQYLAAIGQMEEQKLAVAGEFFVMAATLIEIKSRMLLPKPPKLTEEQTEDEEDPRAELAARLLEYERFKSLVPILQQLEDERSKLLFREAGDLSGLFDLPVTFGGVPASALLHAIERLLEGVGDQDQGVTSVRRRKLSLRLAMRGLLNKVNASGTGGILLTDAFASSEALTRLDIVMTFLALLELLRQQLVVCTQEYVLGPILIHPGAPEPQRG